MCAFDCRVNLGEILVPGYCRSASEVSELLAKRGIERAIVCSAYAANVDPLTGNQMLKGTLDEHPEFYGCLTAHLGRPTASIQSIRDLLGNRRFVATMLVNQFINEPLKPIIAEEILNACRRFQKPIYIHTPNGDCVEVALQLAKSYTMHRFVLLGMGGPDWRSAVGAAHQMTNIMLEISGPPDLRKIPYALEVLGPQRMVFGSGMPAMDPAALIGLLDDLNLRPGDRKRILSDNADRLFGLTEMND